MQEQDLIKQLKELKGVQPRNEWRDALKSQLLDSYKYEQVASRAPRLSGVHIVVRMILGHRLATTTVTLLVFVAAFGVLANAALPGDTFYAVKRVGEQARVAMVPSGQRAYAELQLVQRRLEELERIARENRTQNLSSAIKEYQASADQVVRELEQSSRRSDDAEETEKILAQTRQIQEKEEQIEDTLATEIGDGKLTETAEALYYKPLANELLESLQNSSLTPEQQRSADSARGLIEQGSYQRAFEVLLLVEQNIEGESRE